MGRPPTETKDKLIEKASELIWHHSYNSVSVDEICTQAGVQKGSFYHYFPSKAHLALATMDWCMQGTKGCYDDMFSPTRPPRERFELMVDHILHEQETTYHEFGHVCGCPFATLGSELAAQDEVIGEKIRDICAKKLTYYESALRDLMTEGAIAPDTDVKLKAEEIMAFVIGLMIVARIQNNLDFMRNNLKHSLFHLIGISDTRQAS